MESHPNDPLVHLSLADAQKLDAVQKALRREDLTQASQLTRVLRTLAYYHPKIHLDKLE